MFIIILLFHLYMKKVLLLGFGPFSKFVENPSQIIVERLKDKKIDDLQIFGKILPVTYSEVEKIIRDEIKNIRPQLVLGIGLAAGRNKITLEKIAINYKFSSTPDNTGKIEKGRKINAKGPDGIFTNLNVEKIVEILNRENIPADISLTAGGYICNLTMYNIMENAKIFNFKGGFVHLPCHRELVSKNRELNYPYMELEIMEKAIIEIIKFSLNKKIKSK